MKSLIFKMFLILGVVFSLTSCDKDEERIGDEDLPAVSKSFINDFLAMPKLLQ